METESQDTMLDRMITTWRQLQSNNPFLGDVIAIIMVTLMVLGLVFAVEQVYHWLSQAMHWFNGFLTHHGMCSHGYEDECMPKHRPDN